ncbi:unnamed protein product [Prorocentrum cordatum]|uniref:Uncharacterized protein n=1 Tax=Prorocentrum cordatum TaxID=2364126 RepID=A0ABN9VUA5_9DINO|nr:unnamed protein product [Polarella glacialis]
MARGRGAASAAEEPEATGRPPVAAGRGAAAAAPTGRGARGRGGGGRSAPPREKGKTAAEASSSKESIIGPIGVRQVSADTRANNKGRCGICNKRESAENPFPDVKFPGEAVQKFTAGCAFHTLGYVRGQWYLDHGWVQFCGVCESDKEISEAFDFTCGVAAGQASHAGSSHDVAIKQEIGVTVFSDCDLLTDANYKLNVVPKGAEAVTMADAGERITELHNEHHDETVKGVLIANPDQPFLNVRKWSSSFGSHSEWALEADKNCRDGQGLSTEQKVEKYMRDLLPTALRGHVAVPTLEDVRKRALGAARAKGYMAASHSGSWAEGASPAASEPVVVQQPPRAEPLALCDGEEGARGDAEPAGGHQGATTHASPRSPAPGSAPPGDRAADVRSNADAMSNAGGAMSSSGRKKTVVCDDDAGKHRLQELARDINLCDILDKGKDSHGFGSRIYALRRFKASVEYVTDAQKKLLTDTDVCNSLGGGAVKTLTAAQRVETLKKIKHVNITNARSFKRKLCELHLKETDDVVDRFALCVPWVADLDEAAFSTSTPLDAFIHYVVNGIVKADRVDKANVDALLSAIGDYVGTKELRDAAPEGMRDYACELFVFSQSMAVLMDPTPTALTFCPIRGDVRKFLREELGAEWRLVVSSFGEDLADMLREYSRAHYTDTTHGPKMMEYATQVKLKQAYIFFDVAKPILVDFQVWGGMLRSGGANDFLHLICTAVSGWIQGRRADAAHGARDDEAAHVAEFEKVYMTFQMGAVSWRGVGKDPTHALQQVGDDLGTLREELSKASSESALVQACAAIDPSSDENLQTIREARKACEGMVFARYSTRKVLFDTSSACKSHGIASIKKLAQTDFDGNKSDVVRSAPPVVGIGISLLSHVDKQFQEVATLNNELAVLFLRGQSVGSDIRLRAKMGVDFDFGDEPAVLIQAKLLFEGVCVKFTPPHEAQADIHSEFEGLLKVDGEVSTNANNYQVADPIVSTVGGMYTKDIIAIFTESLSTVLEFPSEYWKYIKEPWVEKINELCKSCGGLINSDGEHWASKYVGDDFASWMDVAKSGLFKQKGLASKCKALENEIRGLRVTCEAVATEHYKVAEFERALAECKQVLSRTHVTMWGAKAMQPLKAEKKSSLKDDLTSLKDELHDSAAMTEQDVLPAVLAEVDRVLAKALNE